MELLRGKVNLRRLQKNRVCYGDFFKEGVEYKESGRLVIFSGKISPSIKASDIDTSDSFRLKEKQRAVGLWQEWKKPNEQLTKLAENASIFFRDNLPELFKKHLDIVQQYGSKFLIGNSIFTSIVINEDYDVGYHKDANTLPGTLEVMITIKSGPEGGYLNFDEFCHTLKNDDGNISIFDGVEYGHSVTQIPEGQKRYTLLFLIHENIQKTT